MNICPSLFTEVLLSIANFNKENFEFSLKNLLNNLEKNISKEHDPSAVLFNKYILENINKFLLLMREVEYDHIREQVSEIMKLNEVVLCNFNILIYRKENIKNFYAIKNINYANLKIFLNHEKIFMHKFKLLEIENILNILHKNFNQILNKFIKNYF